MAISDLYANTLSTLTATRSKMLSPAWQASLDKVTPDDRVLAGNTLMQLGSAILCLSTASLADIALQMSANETQLANSTRDLTDALEDITKVQNILQKLTRALSIIAKIVPLL
jgi:hypothetical protein